MSSISLQARFKKYLKKQKLIRFVRWGVRLLVLVFIMDTGYLIGIWPDWELYKAGPIQRSNFIRHYIFEQYRHQSWPDLQWQQRPIHKISRHMIRALIVAEDASFYSHSGIDMEALQAAMEYNLSEQRFVYGGSTISQQTVKNIFLSASKNPLRKWHELVLTIGMERKLSKRRILELYLNVAEFGRGIFGVEAAARHYWGISASRLSVAQAIQLAATLPAPVNHNPVSRTAFFNKRVKKISRYF
ncbi:MAG: monofunctional biosynthetic peptidoglycan transglycosylase [Gammaproteobacteria bacterium]|nr:monofunctional biosynthetic peptidoglycan transglycosylase [Gammaproteobacteria bacterium]